MAKRTKTARKRTVRKGTRKATKKSAKATGRKAGVKKSASRTTKAGTRAAGGAKKAARKATKKAATRSARVTKKKAIRKATRKATKKSVKKSVKKSGKKAARRGATSTRSANRHGGAAAVVSMSGSPGAPMVQDHVEGVDGIRLGSVVDTLAREEGRQVAMQAESSASKLARKQNLLANSASQRIQGHIKGSVRAAQGKRDAQQRISRGET